MFVDLIASITQQIVWASNVHTSRSLSGPSFIVLRVLCRVLCYALYFVQYNANIFQSCWLRQFWEWIHIFILIGWCLLTSPSFFRDTPWTVIHHMGVFVSNRGSFYRLFQRWWRYDAKYCCGFVGEDGELFNYCFWGSTLTLGDQLAH